jgi:hypothetical protein
MDNLKELESNIQKQIARYFSSYGETNIGHESREDLFELISHEIKDYQHKLKWDGIYSIASK